MINGDVGEFIRVKLILPITRELYKGEDVVDDMFRLVRHDLNYRVDKVVYGTVPLKSFGISIQSARLCPVGI